MLSSQHFVRLTRLLASLPLLCGVSLAWCQVQTVTASLPTQASAKWPVQAVRFIVPFPGGASTLDTVIRLVTPEVSRTLSVPVFVENKPGAGTVIGVDAVAKSTDRHTFGGVANSLTVNQTLVTHLPYNTTTDLQPVILMARTANVLAVRPDLPIHDLRELIAYAKQNPGKLSYGSFGNGTTPHFAGEMLKSMAGIDMVHVPYKGSAPAVVDVASGQVDMMFDGIPSLLPHIKSGKLRPIAAVSIKRNSTLPELPTFTELGYPTMVASVWYGLMAPAGTPPFVVDYVNLALNKTLAEPELQKRLEDGGAIVMPGSPADFGAFMLKDYARWGEVIKKAGISTRSN